MKLLNAVIKEVINWRKWSYFIEVNKEEINEGVLILQLLKVDDNWSKLKYKEGYSWIAVKEGVHLFNMKLRKS